MRTPVRIALSLVAAAALVAFSARGQSEPRDAAAEISGIIYSELSKAEMLERLSPFVRVGDKLDDFHSETSLSFLFCLESGPGVVDCQFDNGLQLVADPDGLIQLIRRKSMVVGDKTFIEMSISTHVLHWKGYARGYPE